MAQEIDIAQLPLPQLSQLNQQMEQELEFLKTSIKHLKGAQGKYQESKSCVEQLAKQSEGKKILVPLTSSLYVPGELADSSTVLIDIGTNFFVDRSVKDGINYFARKSKYIDEQVEKVTPALQEKMRMKQAIVELLQAKIQQFQQQQAAAKK